MSGPLRDEPDQPSRYETICTFYIGQIADGSINPGEFLPAAHLVAEQHGISAATARRGLRLLADLGWATPILGHPYMALLPEGPDILEDLTVMPGDVDFVYRDQAVVTSFCESLHLANM